MTKHDFLYTYQNELVAAFDWAKDPVKLEKFMKSVSATINGNVTSWNFDGDCVKNAWRKIGGKGKPTLKALRALK